MLRELSGRRPVFSAVTRGAMLSLGLVLAAGLSACTTTEGTNAMTDIATFEREVAIETMKGLGMLEREGKSEKNLARGPLVLPKSGAPLPAPKDGRVADLLPEDSDSVRVDTTGLTPEDISRLRSMRVVDLNSVGGRPLTDAEARQLTARMKAVRLERGARPLYLPPDDYFTTVKGQDLVCLAPSGELVPLDDKSCPPEIRKALASAS